MDRKHEGPHVQLSFSLREDGAQRNPTQEIEEIFSVFPTCIALTLMNPFLILQYKTLPGFPWPITVTAIPVYFTTHPESFPLELGLPAAGPPLLLPCELQRWKTPSFDTMHQLFQAFDERKVAINGFQWFGVRLLGEVHGDPPVQWESYFPKRVNKIHISYVFQTTIETPGSLRLKTPTDVEPGDGNYSNMLRPGVILSSGIGADGSELRTTSGVCVESPSGEKFVTCASHGFPLGLEDAYHPSAAGSKIGTAVRQFWDTDISLLRLAEGIQYSRKPFSSSDYDAVPLTSINNPLTLCIGDYMYMNTTFNGHCEGCFVGMKTARIPSDEPGIPHHYIFGTFAYLGNGSERLLDGCCGGVVWTEQGEAIGQFRFLSKERSLAYITSFEHLIQLGYQLSQIGEED